MRYLITGGAGFIGSHLADRLVARGDEILVLDDLSTGNLGNIEHLLEGGRVRFHEGSILDQELVGRLVGEAEAVVHLAAAVGVELVVRRPLHCLITNVKGTETVLEACAAFRRKVLVASTSEIYGKNATGPLREDADRILGSPFVARWTYSTTKALDEIYAHTYFREKGIPTIVVRFFNTVGPRQTGAYGMVIPRLVQQALQARPLTVFGTGDQRRCFGHVHDVVEAVTGLLEHPESVGQVFNIGSQQEIAINDLAARIIEATGSSSTVEHVPYDVAYEEGFEDMDRRVPDTTRITDLLGWRPTRSLDDILADVIDHERRLLAAETGPRGPAREDRG